MPCTCSKSKLRPRTFDDSLSDCDARTINWSYDVGRKVYLEHADDLGLVGIRLHCVIDEV